MRSTVKPLAQAVTIAAAIVASSSALELTGQPLFTTLSEIAINLAAGYSEAVEVRRKIIEDPVVATQALVRGVLLERD
ncbi:MAG TPA: hypothetical protein VGJ20_28915 [Xanthobacteraceae bacterium]|jgi:hypothetical protein